MNQWQMLARFVDTCDLDVVLLAGRYTLLDRSAVGSLFPRCLERNVAVIAGGVCNSGTLAHGTSPDGATFNYVQAAPAVAAQVGELARACESYGRSSPRRPGGNARRGRGSLQRCGDRLDCGCTCALGSSSIRRVYGCAGSRQ